MKKLIFGCTLMLCGAVCGTGWVIAQALLVEPGAYSSLWSLFFSGTASLSCSFTDWGWPGQPWRCCRRYGTAAHNPGNAQRKSPPG